MSEEKVIIPESGFDTSMVDALAAAEADARGIDIEKIKEGFQEAGKNCAIIPALDEYEAERYAEGYDHIAVLENHILDIEEYVEESESRKRSLENTLRWHVEVRATEDKASGLTNETKRRIAYEQLVEDNEELQMLYGELRILRREIARTRVELGNEQRAFQLLVKGGR